MKIMKRLMHAALNGDSSIKWLFRKSIFLASIFCFVLSSFSSSQAKSTYPLPASEAGLPIIIAEPWLQLYDDGSFLEGPAFDRDGNLYLIEILGGKLLKVDMTNKTFTTVYDSKGEALLAACDIHKDGRIFLSDLKGQKVSVVNPDGSGFEDVFTSYEGKAPGPIDDLVFDHDGNFYCTAMSGSVSSPTGRVYRVSADFKKVDVVLDNLAMPNGVAIAPHEGDLYHLWISTLSGHQLLKSEMQADGYTPVPYEQCNTVYRFNGGPGGPDSIAVDSEGNVYQAIYKQGRFLIFDKNGYPTHNVLIPGREEGKQMRTTNLAIKPGTDEVYAVSSGEGGAWIYKFRGLAKAMKLFSHQ